MKAQYDEDGFVLAGQVFSPEEMVGVERDVMRMVNNRPADLASGTEEQRRKKKKERKKER